MGRFSGRRALGLVLGWLLGAAAAAGAQPRFDFDRTPGNLPKTVLPVRYELLLELDPALDRFKGRATIEIEVRQPVASVVLHARDLQAAHAELRQGATVRALQHGAGPIHQSWSLKPEDAAPIAPGRYTLAIDYDGRVNATGEGLFHALSSADGKPARMLATQFEAVEARSVFPAFDEPSFRTAFELSVRAPAGLQVVSNMPEREGSPQPDGSVVLHRFEPTPPMPSYLLAVSVGRFDVISGQAAGVPLRILTAPGKGGQAAYAMGVTKQVLPFFSDYFGVPFALPKLDQLAVPSTRSGAMEDWGLISYSEPAVLFDPVRSSPSTERQVFSVVAHEISHQWFGNLVTAASWEEIWLNEAFATWMETKATAHFNPQWQVQLGRRLPIDSSMVRDAGVSTRSIRSGPVRETAVFNVFDDITYTKGGAVLDMLEAWLGPVVFKQGLQSYMVERKFSNATAGDLWFHIGQAGGRDVAAVAASWTDQPGFPLLTVSSHCEAGRTLVGLRQHRFGDPWSTALWQVPVAMAHGAERNPQVVLLERTAQQSDLPGCSRDPLIVNAGGIGFYRVRYDTEALRRLQRNFTRLPPADQVTLLSDAFALAQFGEQPMSDWFALAREAPRVTGPARTTLFDQLTAQLGFLGQALAGTAAEPLLHRTARTLLGAELKRVGWVDRADDSPQTRKLRGRLIESLAYHDDTATVVWAKQLFERAEAGGAALPASIRAAVIRAVGRHADAAQFDRLLSHLRDAAGEEDRWIYASALAGGRHRGRAQQLLAASIEGVTTPNIAARLPGMVAARSPFSAAAYAFTLAHWDALAKLAGTSFGAASWLLPSAAELSNERSRIAPMRADQRSKAGPDGEMPAAQAAANISLLADLRERETKPLIALWSAAGAAAAKRR